MTKSPDPKPKTTDVLGYKNNNTFPISITSDQLGVNTQVAPKSYVLDRQGRKINDPRLDHWTSHGGLLSKEFSASPVPLILLGGSPVAKASPAASVAARGPVSGVFTPAVSAPAGGIRSRIPVASPEGQSVSQPATASTSIRAMTVAEATQSGLIPRPDRRDRFERLPNEDLNGVAAASKQTPFIDSLSPQQSRLANAPKIQLRTVDTSGVPDLVAPDAASAITGSVAREAGVAVPAKAPKPAKSRAPVIEVQAAPVAAKGVEYNGKIYTNPGHLKKDLIASFGGDRAMADEAYEPFKQQFAAIRAS